MTPPFGFSPKLGRYELTDEQYKRLEPLLSGKPGDPGRNAENNRRFLNAVLWIARTGAPWPDLPERFGKYDTIYQRFNNWAKKGRWQVIFEALREPDLDWWVPHSSVVRAHQHAAGRKKGIQMSKRSGEAEEASPRKSTSSAMRSATR
ncbi:putative transposase [Salinibacter ruber]|nr:putative transposase [Salinibacter ruber]